MRENPFSYGEAVSGDYFTDRETEINELKNELFSGQNVTICSPRRYGKTSLIKKVLKELKKEGLITVYLDLFFATSQEKFIDIYAKALAKGIGGNPKGIVESLKNFLPRLIPKVIFHPEGTLDFEFSYDLNKGGAQPVLEDLYESVHKYAARKKRKAVLVLDEFQEILNFQEKEEMERGMRSHFQFHRNVAYVFLGSKYHLMQKLFENKNRAFYHSGRTFILERISQDIFFKWIKLRFHGCNTEIADEDVEKILRISRSHPYHTQQLCHVVWNKSERVKKVSPQHIDQAVKEILAEQSANFTNLWDPLTAIQRTFLMALSACEPINPYNKEFILKNRLGTTSNVQKTIRSLMEKQIIEKENGKIVFYDVFFPMWITKGVLLS